MATSTDTDITAQSEALPQPMAIDPPKPKRFAKRTKRLSPPREQEPEGWYAITNAPGSDDDDGSSSSSSGDDDHEEKESALLDKGTKRPHEDEEDKDTPDRDDDGDQDDTWKEDRLPLSKRRRFRNRPTVTDTDSGPWTEPMEETQPQADDPVATTTTTTTTTIDTGVEPQLPMRSSTRATECLSPADDADLWRGARKDAGIKRLRLLLDYMQHLVDKRQINAFEIGTQSGANVTLGVTRTAEGIRRTIRGTPDAMSALPPRARELFATTFGTASASSEALTSVAGLVEFFYARWSDALDRVRMSSARDRLHLRFAVSKKVDLDICRVLALIVDDDPLSFPPPASVAGQRQFSVVYMDALWRRWVCLKKDVVDTAASGIVRSDMGCRTPSASSPRGPAITTTLTTSIFGPTSLSLLV